MRIISLSLGLLVLAATLARADAVREREGAIDENRALVLFDRACAAGSGRACDELAHRLATSKLGASRYRSRIVALHRRACSVNDRAGCVHSGEQRLADGDRAAAYIDFWNACDLGDAQSCYRAGVLANVPDRARILMLRACDARIANGCAQLADMFANGRGGERNWREAIVFAEKACRLGGDRRCMRVRALKQRRPDWRCTSETTCERLCAEGIARSCRRLAELRDDAPDAYERGCVTRDGESCTRRGHAATTLEVGAKWYARGCAAGDRSACTYRDYANATDGSRGALDSLRKRCASDRDACVLLGLAILDRRTTEAARLWQGACDRNHGIACRLLAQEFGGPSSKPLMKRACRIGDGVACTALSLFAPPRRPGAPAWL